MKNVHLNPIDCRYGHFQKFSPSDLDLGRKKKKIAKEIMLVFFSEGFYSLETQVISCCRLIVQIETSAGLRQIKSSLLKVILIDLITLDTTTSHKSIQVEILFILLRYLSLEDICSLQFICKKKFLW